ncbi:hypothetical protein [Mucilaginibacter boryungensis]|uniref:Uncharacterized protein n=1 Tax=Mucilaginibacter boryungensis TaxID=768480 RepID=A0ABR9XCR4_9SPHI|nr:hypothetical protein [Mucilaginibacter boryungensis]MBE9665192.1 hypothetical protein [Mucilaginibacter boryungensis]
MNLKAKVKLIIIALVTFTACKNPHKITGIAFKADMQFVNAESNKLFTITDSLTICYCNNYTVYKLPYVTTTMKAKTNKNGDYALQQTSENSIKYNFVIHSSDNRYAYWFDSLSSERPRRINFDSLLNFRAYGNFPFFQKAKDTLLKTEFNSSANILIKKYIPKIRVDDSYPDTMYYYFKSGFKGVKYSFSKDLDIYPQFKLFKVEFITNKVPKGNKGMDIPKRKFLFEVKETKIDTTSLIKLVEKFETMEKKL